jgi:WD40 repeat protein
MKDLSTIILDLLSTKSSPIPLSDITKDNIDLLENEIYLYLIALWKEGKVFANEVVAQKEAYIPSKQATWTTKRSLNFFGHSTRLGAYQIGTDSLPIFNVQLQATLYIGSPVYSIAVSPIKEIFAVGDDSGVISICSLLNAVVIKKEKAHSGRVLSLDYSADGNDLVSGSLTGEISLWNEHLDGKKKIGEVEDWVTSTRFSPDGKHILTGHKLARSSNPPIRIWSKDKASFIQTFLHHNNNVYSVEYLPDGSGFISCGSDNKVACWSFERDELAYRTQKHTGTVSCLALHPFANQFSSGAWTGTIKIWDSTSGAMLKTIEAHGERVTSLRYTHSGNILASGSKDSTIALWKMPESVLLGRTPPGQGWVRSLAFDNLDSRLLSGSSDGYIRIWGIIN